MIDFKDILYIVNVFIVRDVLEMNAFIKDR